MTSHPRIIISYTFGKKSIPLGFSCARALKSLGCEVCCFDIGVNSPADLYFLKPINQIIWGLNLKKIDISANSKWNDQKFLQRALEKNIKEFRPDILLVIRGNGFDRNFLRKMRERYSIKLVGWWTEGPKWFNVLQDDARVYDYYFCIHKEGYTDSDPIIYFPALAVDQLFYRKKENIRKRQDITFIGKWNHRRQNIVNTIADFPISIYGPKWIEKNLFNVKILKSIKKIGLWGEKVVDVYNSTKIGLDISQWDKDKFSGLNLRAFDIPSCGTFFLADYSKEIEEIFKIGEEIETYQDVQELKNKLNYYLLNDSVREKIAEKGYEKTLKLETYIDKMKKMLKLIGN